MSYIVPQKMPLRCFECGHISLSTIYGYGCKITHKSLESDPGINVRRPDWCPLVEIPTPHGRLIDADKLNIHDVSPAYGFCVMGVTEEDIGLVDTVIEAEGDKKQDGESDN